MNNPAKSFLLPAIPLTLVILNPISGLSKDKGPKTLIAKQEIGVLIHNYTDLSGPDLKVAMDRASTILKKAGIGVLWIDKGSQNLRGSNQSGGGIDLDRINYFLRILPESRDVLKDNALGEALPCKQEMGSCYANLFLNRVQERAEFGRISVEQVLGHAIAHELGHLLMGFSSHYPSGIMRAQWGPAELKQAAKGDLLFTPEQIKRIHANLTRTHINRQNAIAKSN